MTTHNNKQEIQRNKERPVPLVPLPDHLPVELRGLATWIGWRYEWDEQRRSWSKIPINPRTGYRGRWSGSGTNGTGRSMLRWMSCLVVWAVICSPCLTFARHRASAKQRTGGACHWGPRRLQTHVVGEKEATGVWRVRRALVDDGPTPGSNVRSIGKYF